ncbi:hypothetical protein FB107DRAFT_280437 [Schizophyllum commune]
MFVSLSKFKSPWLQLMKGQLVGGPGSTSKPLAWQDDTPRCYQDSNGTPLLVHLPSLLLNESLKSATDALIDFAKLHPSAVSSSAGADAKSRDPPDSYRALPGHISGQLKLVKAWHRIGHHPLRLQPTSLTLPSDFETPAIYCAICD